MYKSLGFAAGIIIVIMFIWGVLWKLILYSK
jgi:hypothetical protein